MRCYFKTEGVACKVQDGAIHIQPSRKEAKKAPEWAKGGKIILPKKADGSKMRFVTERPHTNPSNGAVVTEKGLFITVPKLVAA